MTTHNIQLHYIDDMRASYDKDAALQPHTVVWSGDIKVLDPRINDRALCEIAFDRFNRHDSPSQHPALDELGIRSLSVGDVVEIVEPGNSRFYICASFGFDPVEGVRSAVA